MDVELFVVPDCPNESVALSLLCLAFDRVGLAAQSPAYACRVYATPAGLSGVPPLGDVISALTAASNRELASPE